ncbi:Protein xylosyltransferase [Bertholletia excelsa]
MVLPCSSLSIARLPPLLALVSFAAFLFFEHLIKQVEYSASPTKKFVGPHIERPSLQPDFPRSYLEEMRSEMMSKFFKCSHRLCRFGIKDGFLKQNQSQLHHQSSECLEFFLWIHHDLEPWKKSRISLSHLMEVKKHAAFRAVIVGGKLYVDMYALCVQRRSMFTVWGLLQLLKRYPGMVPDVDMMFDCSDKPKISRKEHRSMPLPLFRYCTTSNHFDIPFPDWSFWGWPELNIGPWDEELSSIRHVSQARSWQRKWPVAYWKGNPSTIPLRSKLLTCNDSRVWKAQIMHQDWGAETLAGFKNSNLSKQCDHRYKIYAEGLAWSASLKYILSCGSVPLVIASKYEEFFSRGLFPKKNYWPVSAANLCRSIKHAVDWGNANLAEAEAIGRESQNFMGSMSMDRVYNYMFHLINEYSKLLNFKPVPPPSAIHVCAESLLCFADPLEKQFFQRSATSSPAETPLCVLHPPDRNYIKSWVEEKRRIIRDVEISVN